MGPARDAKLRVLLVEDDDDIRALLRTRLELDERFTVVAEAWNGAHGVGQAKVHQPDAVVLDVLMPVLDGATALPLIRKMVPRAVIITFSALPADHPRIAMLRDTDGHITKTETTSLPDALYEAWASRRQAVSSG